MLIWGRRIIINRPGLLKEKGPLLLACNHPNSFLDSILLNTLFDQPVWSLARGDAFKKPFYARLLTKLKILPVYRTSEGVENLSENYRTFEDCINLFKENAIVTIFSEGKCINEWHLRALKKGTARLAIKAWEENIPLKVLPVGINYSSFHRFGKNIFLNFGSVVHQEEIDISQPDGLRHQAFNKRLQNELEQLVLEIPKGGDQKILEIKIPFVEKILLAIPALLGYLIHLPLYWPVKSIVAKRTKNNDHFDSVMTGILILVYPLYLVLLIIIAALLMKSWLVLTGILLLPSLAWAYIRLKPQLD
jgi:1-acyl-sn-glycerol-3-phosphate acyltransferase